MVMINLDQRDIPSIRRYLDDNHLYIQSPTVLPPPEGSTTQQILVYIHRDRVPKMTIELKQLGAWDAVEQPTLRGFDIGALREPRPYELALGSEIPKPYRIDPETYKK